MTLKVLFKNGDIKEYPQAYYICNAFNYVRQYWYISFSYILDGKSKNEMFEQDEIVHMEQKINYREAPALVRK
jgi:hypothetical protein